MERRPAIAKGRDVPKPYRLKEATKDKDKAEREAAKAREWIMKGMKEDERKRL